MQLDFKIAGTTIQPGQQEIVYIPLPALHSDTHVSMPVHVIHGKKEGPVLFISSAVHGDEINGVEIIRRVLNLRSINRLKGTLLAIPTVNVFGFDGHSRYLPDRRDLNRFFPGKELGTLAARLANIFMTEIVKQADVGIDLHTAAMHRDNFPQIRADLNDEKLNQLARVFATPVLLDSTPPVGSLRHAAAEESVSVMVYEAGEALRFDEISIRVAVKGILNVMQEMRMLPKRQSKKIKPPVLLRSSTWVRASRSGILRAQVKLGDMIKKDDILGIIGDRTGVVEDEIIANTSGIIIGRTNIPLIYEGEALFHIGRTQQTSLLEEHLDKLHDDDSMIPSESDIEPEIV